MEPLCRILFGNAELPR